MKKDDCFFIFNLSFAGEKKNRSYFKISFFHYKNLSLTVDSKVYDSIQLAIELTIASVLNGHPREMVGWPLITG